MAKGILEILLDEANRDYWVKHHDAIKASLTSRKKVELPPLNDDDYWSRTETMH